MSERLRARDLVLLASESAATPLHNATLEVFEPGKSGFDYDGLVRLIGERIAFVPRYRQRVSPVPGGIANPVWSNDPDFDLSFHVRRSALPRPGTAEQLRDLASRIVSRPLDRGRPLWEVYFIEGLDGGRVAILAKSHQLLVDGIETVDLGQVLLDDSPEPKHLEGDDWHPGARPSGASLVLEALSDSITDPTTVLSTLRSGAQAVVRGVGEAAKGAEALVGTLAGSGGRKSPLGGVLSHQRRILTVATDLSDYRDVRGAHECTINDVILATIAGGLRAWLLAKSGSVERISTIKAVVPMSVIDDELEPTSLGSQITAHHVELPVSESNPLMRLHQVAYSFAAHQETGRAVGAERLAGISGFAPTTFHALGSRVAAAELGRGFDLAVTNVPGPQFPLYAAGAKMVETYPIGPLLPGHGMAVGVTSYDGHVFYGVTADRDVLPDIELFGQCLIEALGELKDTIGLAKTRAPRGRRKGS